MRAAVFAPLALSVLPLAMLGPSACSSSSNTGDLPPIVETGGYHGLSDGGSGGAAGDSSAQGGVVAGTGGATTGTGGVTTGIGGTSSVGGTGGMPTFPVTMRTLPVKDTEPAATTWLDDHVVFVRDPLAIKPRLFVHLARTGGHPGDSLEYLKIAAQTGYMVLSLSYPNTDDLAHLCGADAGCWTAARQEILQGVDVSKVVTVGVADSIQNRITKAVLSLSKQFPDEGWETLLEPATSGAAGAGGAGGAGGGGGASGGAGGAPAKEPRWASLTVSGHGFGAGEAAYVASLQAVEHVTMLDGPDDPVTGGWLAAPIATPSNRFYGFVHTKAPAYTDVLAAWGVIGCDKLPSLIELETNSFPFSYTHALTTSLPAATGVDADVVDSLITDATTPRKEDGSPLYADGWRTIVAPY